VLLGTAHNVLHLASNALRAGQVSAGDYGGALRPNIFDKASTWVGRHASTRSDAYAVGDLIPNIALLFTGGAEADASRVGLGVLDRLAITAGPERLAITAAPERLAITSGTGAQTTILGENMAGRVMPYAEATGFKTLGWGATREEWAAMTPAERYALNDRMLRTRISAGDSFQYIGQDAARSPLLRQQFDLTASELLRLDYMGIPYEVISSHFVIKMIGAP
jgi:hypothetical protein